MGKITALLAVLITVFIVSVNSAVAQNEQLESCFKYYDYAKVKVYLGSDKSSFSAGEAAVISGTLNNQNSFPLRGVSLYGQLKRVNETADFSQNGHFLVDKLTFLTDINLLPQEVKNISFQLPLLANYPKGEYQLQYFVFSQQGFNYAGRNFLEEDTAGVTNFTINGETAVQAYFDPSSLTVNGNRHAIREQLAKFSKERLEFEVNLFQSSPANAAMEAKYYFYSYDDSLESNLVNQGKEIVSPQNNYTLNAHFTPQTSGAYVFLATIEKPFKSMIKYRFAIEGDDPSPLKINDLGITNFPPTALDRAYLCFHSATDRDTPTTTVRLSILDGENNLIAEKEVTASFDKNVQAISLPLDTLSDRTMFAVRGELISEVIPEKNQAVTLSYSCDRFAGAVNDFNLTFDPKTPEFLVIAGTDACGATNRIGGVIDQIKISNIDGALVNEDYNRQLPQGEYNLGNLPGGNYTVEAKLGDAVRVLNIAVPAKADEKKLKIVWLVFLIVAIVIAGLFIWKRKKKKKGEKREK